MIAPNKVYHLVDGVLDEGLGFVSQYVENMLKLPVIIADGNGRIQYPNMNNSDEVDSLFVSIPANISGRDYYYQQDNKYLYYRVRYNSSSAFIIAKNVPVNRYPRLFPS